MGGIGFFLGIIGLFVGVSVMAYQDEPKGAARAKILSENELYYKYKDKATREETKRVYDVQLSSNKKFPFTRYYAQYKWGVDYWMAQVLVVVKEMELRGMEYHPYTLQIVYPSAGGYYAICRAIDRMHLLEKLHAELERVIGEYCKKEDKRWDEIGFYGPIQTRIAKNISIGRENRDEPRLEISTEEAREWGDFVYQVRQICSKMTRGEVSSYLEFIKKTRRIYTKEMRFYRIDYRLEETLFGLE